MEKSKNQKGFTLIEVLIAIALLTIGILGAASMQIASIGGNNHAIRLTTAATWAGDALETLMALEYTDDDLADDSNTGANAGVTGLNNTDIAGSMADEVDPQVKPGGYTVFWNVAENYPLVGCKTIRVLVRRSDKGVVKTVTQDFIKMEPI